MIEGSSRIAKKVLASGDLFTLAAALLMALAVYFFLQTLVEGLIAPFIAVVFSEPGIYALTFSLDGTEFGYGAVLSALILLVLVFLVVAGAAKFRQASDDRSTDA